MSQRKDMLGPIVRALVGVPRKYLGTILDVVNRLGSDVADAAHFAQNLKKFLRGEVEFVESEKPKLLEFVETVSVGGAERFIVREKFREGETVDGVRIVSLSDNFKEYFLDKDEENIPETHLRVSELQENSRDIPIITELGGEEIVEITFAHLWDFLKSCSRGYYVLYIRDEREVLRTVSINSNPDGDRGWDVGAGPLGHLFNWENGDWFVSCLPAQTGDS